MANPFSVNVVNPLQALMMGEEGYKSQQQSGAREKAAQAMMSGDPNASRSAIAMLMGIGDMQGANILSNLGNNERDFQFRQTESNRQQGNADRSFVEGQRQFNAGAEGQRVPPGFMQTPDGGLTYKPNGPADPNYIRSVNDAKEKPRQMSVGDVTKLQEDGAKFSNLTGFVDTFKNEFGGQGPIKAMGDLRNWVGRTLPESIVDSSAAAGATWWQGYDRFKNIVRNELFGAALTPSEQAAFEKADINNTMQPDQIRKNLKTQQDIVKRALTTKAGALVNEGYRPETISKAYGVKLEDLGVSKPPSGPAPQSAAPQQQSSQTWTDPQTNKTYVIRNGKMYDR